MPASRSTIVRSGASLLAMVSLAALVACRGNHEPASFPSSSSSSSSENESAPATRLGGPRPLSPAAQVGRALFFDKTLSASGEMSCATCHDPDHAYAPPNDKAVQLGGPRGTDAGTRAVPSLRYKEFTPPYADLFDNPDGISAPGPGGGLAWDGRASTLAEQARLPLLSPVEMANASPADVVRKIAAAPYADRFRKAFPGVIFAETDDAFNRVLSALQAFQLEDPSFHPYSSKFDRHADNKIGGDFTPAEARGFRAFIDAKVGNCSACHFVGAGFNGSSGLFTDYSYEAIGVPRNRAIAANDDARFFDLGLCGPARTDHLPSGETANSFCGLFKTPTLRNVATRRAFFHNGVMHSLEQAIRFYATRDTAPELWYPTVGGKPKAQSDRADRAFPGDGLITNPYLGGAVAAFDDLPARFRGNLDAQMPLDGRERGSKPPLTEENIADLICFLETLTDDFQPPAQPPVSGRCVD